MSGEHEWMPMIHAFNREHEKSAVPITIEMLTAHPKGSVGKNGWFCKYSLFQEEGQWILASYEGHRMTNSQYQEFNLSGKCIYGYCAWDWASSDEHDADWREASRRAKRAGLDTPIDK